MRLHMTSSSDAARAVYNNFRSLFVCFYQERNYFLCERFSVAEVKSSIGANKHDYPIPVGMCLEDPRNELVIREEDSKLA